ncbi:MAG: fused MFS/spermidine synthase [Candidatus Yonathbacteria bacterium]|nr:fused MFS/spermidine synthase [Candidatus Yonathbacteria bacterium]
MDGIMIDLHFKSWGIPAAVFFTGACSLIVEVVAVRVLSPYYGNTMYTVSGVISVILGALSIGYYLGGILADRKVSVKQFFTLTALSGLVLVVAHSGAKIFLPAISAAAPLSVGPLISALFFFLPPSLLLGTLSPYAIAVQRLWRPEQGVGSAAGSIFFWSTLGSILGSLLAGFVLIPHFGTGNILTATGIALFVGGGIPVLFIGLSKKEKKQLTGVLGIFILLTISSLTVPERVHGTLQYRKDGIYELLTVVDRTYNGRPARLLLQDKGISGGMYLDTENPDDFVFGFTSYYSLYTVFKPDVHRALVIGGGPYIVPKAILASLPEATVDVAEIEPSLHDIAKTYFELPDDPRLHNYVEDGRRLLRGADGAYDMIFSDVYYSLYSLPAHVTTREFFEEAKKSLSPDGLFVANIIGDLSRRDDSFILSEMRTFKSVFPNAYFFAVDSPGTVNVQNIIFVGWNGEGTIDFSSPEIVHNANPTIASLAMHQIDPERFDLSKRVLLRDEFAPVEYMTAKLLNRSFLKTHGLEGGEMFAVLNQIMGYGPRYVGSEGKERTASFLEKEMNALAKTVVIDSWSYPSSDGTIYPMKNIIARFRPDLKNRIVIGTHYDSKKFADKDLVHPGEPVPGANDSGSGTAVLVELARTFADVKNPLPVGVDIVFFDGEEGDPALSGAMESWEPIGATRFAHQARNMYGKQLPSQAIVLDMVCDKDLQIYREKSSTEQASKETEMFWDIARSVHASVFFDDIRWGILDDHTPLNVAGIPSTLVIDFDYPYHHTTEDTIDKCSGESMVAVGEAVRDYVYSLK